MAKFNEDKTLSQISTLPVQEQINFLNKVKSLVTGSIETEQKTLQAQADKLRLQMEMIGGDTKTN